MKLYNYIKDLNIVEFGNNQKFVIFVLILCMYVCMYVYYQPSNCDSVSFHQTVSKILICKYESNACKLEQLFIKNEKVSFFPLNKRQWFSKYHCKWRIKTKKQWLLIYNLKKSILPEKCNPIKTWCVYFLSFLRSFGKLMRNVKFYYLSWHIIPTHLFP